MKSKFTYIFLFFSVLFFGCSDNSDLKNELNQLREELNTQRQLIEALQNGTTIKEINYTENGYIIELSNNSLILFNSSTPLLSLNDDNYWRLNGKETGVFCKDINAVPAVTVGDNNHWFINGEDTGIVAENNSQSSVVNVFMDGQKMVFVFSDGTQVSLNLDLFSNQVENDICIPKYMYLLSDTQNNLFVEAFIKRWKSDNNFVRFAGSITYSRRTDRVASIDQPLAWRTVSVALYNNDFEIIKHITSIIRLGKKGIGSKPVYVQILGDSFVQGAFFKDALLTKGYVPNIHMVGLRKIDGETAQYDEGRGGDMLKDYFGVHTSDTKAYQGYMHPDGDYKYYGPTGFWINCHKVMSGNTGLSYTCGRYDDYAIRFDATTGYLLSPNTNDVQYDNSKGRYVKYDGNQWADVTENLTWSFSYKKYLEAWNITAPQFFGENLGLNDFRNDINADFTEWNERIEIMKNSYLEAVPNGKFMILIPSSTCGSMNNANGDFTLYQNAAMWRLRKNIIDKFDNRESEGYYLVDVGITIDNEDGYYKDANGVQTGNPHPYPNYPTMGIPIAAFIQFHREK